MNATEAEKKVTELSESLITPKFIKDLRLMGILMGVIGAVFLFMKENLTSIFFLVLAGIILLIVLYVKKNFEWK